MGGVGKIRLGQKSIEIAGNEVYIIAEIGQNHQGSINIAKQMILAAKKAGCDCVKFQKSCLPAKFTKSALNRLYDGEHSWGKTYGEHKNHLEFTIEQYRELQTYCNEVQIDFTASAMDEVSLELLEELNVPFVKIGSGDANNFPMLRKAAKISRPLVISTGMQTWQTVKKIVDVMNEANKTNYALLHCVSAYPTDAQNCNLQMIPLLQQSFPNVVIGYSGHEIGTNISMAAVYLGAKIIERHFTLDKQQKGSDHKCSLEPNELEDLVGRIRKIKDNCRTYKKDEILKLLHDKNGLELSLKPVTGKNILSCELNCKQKLGKSLVAAKNLKCGHILQADDICIKVSEPNGVYAEEYEEILGSKLIANVIEDHPITHSHITIA